MFKFLSETLVLRIGWSQRSQKETVFAQTWWQIKLPPRSPSAVDPDLQTESAYQATKVSMTGEDQDLSAEVASQATEMRITGKDQDLLAEAASQAGKGLASCGDQDLKVEEVSPAGNVFMTWGDQDLLDLLADSASQARKELISGGDQDLQILNVPVDQYKIKEKTRAFRRHSKTSSVHLCWEWKEFAKEVNQRLGEDQDLLEEIITLEMERRIQAELGWTLY